MRKIVFVLVGILVALFFTGNTVFAQDSKSQKITNVKNDEVISHDFFASGDTVIISGKVFGDAYVFAQKIVVDGEVNGDLIAAGGEILIPGKVAHDARLAASKISISGAVDGSVTAGTGEFIFGRDGRIGNSLVIGTKDVSLQGYVGRDLRIWANKVTVNNNVSGSIIAAVTDLTLDPGARIGGDVTYWASNNLVVNMGSEVRGQTIKHEIKTDIAAQSIEKSLAGLRFTLKVFGFLLSLFLGLLFIKLMPTFSSQISEYIVKKTFRSFWVGILTLVATPLLILVLLLTIIGIPFAFILLFLLVLVFCVSKIFVALAVGNLLEARLKLNNSLLVKFVGGLITMTLLSMIPIIGGIFNFIALFAGAGAFAACLFTLHKNLLAKKLI